MEKSPEREMPFAAFVSGLVCRRCNTGWMSKLEADAKPVLIPLIKGSHRDSLSGDECQLIAAWIFKTALALHTVSHQGIFISESHYRTILNRRAIPAHVMVAIGNAKPTKNFAFIQNQNWHASGKPPENLLDMFRQSYRISLQAGCLVMRVHYWPYDSYVSDYCLSSVKYVCPVTRQGISWPPKDGIETLQELDQMSLLFL